MLKIESYFNNKGNILLKKGDTTLIEEASLKFS